MVCLIDNIVYRIDMKVEHAFSLRLQMNVWPIKPAYTVHRWFVQELNALAYIHIFVGREIILYKCRKTWTCKRSKVDSMRPVFQHSLTSLLMVMIEHAIYHFTKLFLVASMHLLFLLAFNTLGLVYIGESLHLFPTSYVS